MKLKDPTFCPIPWNSLALQQNGSIRICCMMTDPNHFGKLMDGKDPLRFSKENMEVARNHDLLKDLRKQMLEGDRHPACMKCYSHEDIGIFSKRLHMLQDYAQEIPEMMKNTNPDGSINEENLPLKYLDLRLGNLCNLKCRSCGPTDSSLWVDDYASLFKPEEKVTMWFYGDAPYDIVKDKKGWKIDSDHFSWHEDPYFQEWFNEQICKGMNRIYFTGGEPTINKAHMSLLEKIIQTGKNQEVSLEYNSNMVAIPPRLFEMWGKFKHVRIGASIDAIGSLASYVRHPGRWEDVEKNCDEIGYGKYPNISASIATTISILNVRHFLDLSRWLIEKRYLTIWPRPSWHVLHGPEYLNIQCLPIEIKKEIEKEYESFYLEVTNEDPERGKSIRDYYSGIIRFMYSDDRPEHLPKLKRMIKHLDGVRNESVRSSLPWLADLIDRI